MTDQLKTVFTVLSLILAAIGLVPYIVGTLRGKTKPHLYSWFVWTLLTGTAFFGQISDGAGKGSWVTIINSAQCFIIFLLAFKYGEKKITASDRISLTMAIAAILLWAATDTPLYSMILVTLTDTFGFYPTFRKSWEKPWEENITAFALAAAMFTLGLLSLERYSVTTVIYPAYLAISNTTLCVYLLWRRRVRRSASAFV